MKKKGVVIGIYNESKAVWSVNSTNDSRTNVIEKSYKRVSDKGIVKDYKLTLGVQKDSCRENIVENILSKTTQTSELIPIFGEPVSIGFSKRSLDPYIKAKDPKNEKSIILATINTHNKRLVDMKLVGSQILDYGYDTVNMELNLIISGKYDRSSVLLSFYDSDKKDILNYSFSVKAGRVYLDKYSRSLNRKDKNDGIKLRKYRPYYPTYCILTYKRYANDVRKLLKSGNYNLPSHRIEIIDKREETVVNNLLNTGYRAITVFKMKDDYKTIDSLTGRFKVVYDMNENGRIFQKKL